MPEYGNESDESKEQESNEQELHFYVNPLTGRLIKSNAKTYTELKLNGYRPRKDKCLYDLNTSKKCINLLRAKYGKRVYPSSNFIKISI